MLWSELRQTFRGLRRRPAFAAVVLVTLALGIGANAAIFSVVNAVLLRPLPFTDPARVVALQQMPPFGTVSEPEFMDYRRDARSLQYLSAFGTTSASLGSLDEPQLTQAAQVSDDFFHALGVTPAFGRAFSADEMKTGGPAVVVLSYGLWRRAFGARPGIVGQTMLVEASGIRPGAGISGRAVIVGVMPPRFDFPTGVGLWIPLRLDPDSLWSRNNHYLSVFGRLAPGATVMRADADVGTLSRRFMRDHPETYNAKQPLAAAVIPMRDLLVGSTRPYLLALFGAVALILMIACVNVANLLLARGEDRRKEVAVRAALGASSARLARETLAESMVLGLAGATVGVVLAWWGVRALIAAAPASMPRLDEARVDPVVLAFALALALATSLLFGIVPALRVRREDAAQALRDGGRASAQGIHGTARRVLVAAEVALAVVILGCTGLLLRSLVRLEAVPLGLDPAHVLTLDVDLPRGYNDDGLRRFYHELLARVAMLPGVRAAGAVQALPVSGGQSRWSIAVEGHAVTTIGDAPAPMPDQVTPGYFRAMSVSVLRGREFTDADREGAPLVTVVNETMARQLWPGHNPVGQRFRMFMAGSPWVTVVGVVGDVRSGGFAEAPPPTMYFPYAQAGKSAYFTPRGMTLVVKVAGDPMAPVGQIRQAVRGLDRSVPLSNVRTMDEVVGASIAKRRFSTALLGGFALLALALAGVGIYGVISYGVSRRTYEMGLRQALGADRLALVGLVVGEGLRMTVAGLVVGLAGAVLSGRLIAALLVDTAPTDLPTWTIVSLVLLLVSGLAAAIPARRATCVPPSEALRSG